MAAKLVTIYSDPTSQDATKLRNFFLGFQEELKSAAGGWTGARQVALGRLVLDLRSHVRSQRRRLVSGTNGTIGSSQAGAGGLTFTSAGEKEQRTLNFPARSVVRITIDLPPVA